MIKHEVRSLSSTDYNGGPLTYPGLWLFTWSLSPAMGVWTLISVEPFVEGSP